MDNVDTPDAPVRTPAEIAYSGMLEDTRKFVEWNRDAAQHLTAWIEAHAGDYTVRVDKNGPQSFDDFDQRKRLSFTDVIYAMMGNLVHLDNGRHIKLRPKPGAKFLAHDEASTGLSLASVLKHARHITCRATRK